MVIDDIRMEVASLTNFSVAFFVFGMRSYQHLSGGSAGVVPTLVAAGE